MGILRVGILGLIMLSWVPIAVAQPLRDVEQHWAKDCISRLAARKQMNGYPDGRFRPEQRLTRAEYAVLMLNAYPKAIASDRPVPNFRDLSPQHWAYSAMRKAYQRKIFVGYPDNTLRPDQPISRVEALAILFSLASPHADVPERFNYNLPEFPLPSQPQFILQEQFADARQIPAWAVKPLSGVAAAFWVVDYPQGQRLRPQEATTRADAAAFLCQAAGWDGLVPVDAVVGSGKFARSPALTQLMRARTEGKPAWFDRQRQVTVVPTLPGRKLLAVGPLVEGFVSAQFETADPEQAYGFLDRQGRLAIAPQFRQVGNFSEGLAAVYRGDKVGFVDPTGKRVIAPQFDQAQPFQEGLAAVRQAERWGFVDRTGQLVVPWQAYEVSSFSEGLARIATQPEWMTRLVSYGFINRLGQVVIPPDYSSAASFSSGVAAVSRYNRETLERREGYLDSTGAWTLSNAVGSGNASFSEGLAARWSGTQFGYIDTTGQWAIPPHQLAANSFGPIQSAGPFQSGFAVVKIGDRYGLINRQGKVVVPPIYGQIQDIGDGYAYVNYGGTWVGYIGGYDGSATPVGEQIFLGGKWGYVKLP